MAKPRKVKVTNIFSDDIKTHNEYANLQDDLLKTQKVHIVESGDIDDPKEAYANLTAKFRSALRNGVFDVNEPEGVMQARYLMKLGWRAGMQTNDLIEYVTDKLPDDKKRFASKILKDARDIVLTETNMLSASEVFTQYVERVRYLINKWEEQAERIARFWKRGGDETMLHREYSVIWKLIFDAEKEMLKVGKDLGIFSTKERDEVIHVEFAQTLLPDPELAKAFVPKSMKEIKKEQIDRVEVDEPKAFEVSYNAKA